MGRVNPPRAQLVLLSTRSPLVHAGRPDRIDADDYGAALCGAQGYADRLEGQLLHVHPAVDANVSCRRCRASAQWR
jgi:hypothetical protein